MLTEELFHVHCHSYLKNMKRYVMFDFVLAVSMCVHFS